MKVKLYGHATTGTCKTIKVVPSSKTCILWAPAAVAPPEGEDSFEASNLGTWMRGREAPADGSGKVERKGLLRQCFEVEFDHARQLLNPSGGKDTNALCLITVQKHISKARS